MTSFHFPSARTAALVGLGLAFLALNTSYAVRRDPSTSVLRIVGTDVAAETPPHVQPRSVVGQESRVPESALAALPLHFEMNRGQTDPQVKFLARGLGYTLFLTPSEAVWSLNPRSGRESERVAGAAFPGTPVGSGLSAVLRMALVGASKTPIVEGFDPLPGRVNYFKGSDRHRWQSGVPTYGRVRYHQVYAGIDVMYYGNGRALEYDFEVAPGADPSRIRMAFDGANDISVEKTGELTLVTRHGELRLQKPFIFQQRGDRREEVAGGYVLDPADRSVTFEIGDYDPTRPLIIDPVLLYSSYLGGSGSDTGTDIAVDAAGNIYVTGYTASGDFPLASAAQPQNAGGNSDLFVARLNPSGTALMYSTYFGDAGGDAGMGITVDTAGNAYVVGVYGLPPSLSQYALVAKFSPTGALVYGAVFGTGSGDIGYAIAVDAAGNAYVTGRTGGASNFPTTANAFQPVAGGFQDAFVSVLNPDGNALVYSTYLGGDLNDQGRAIALDGAGNVYVAGGTMTGFPTTAGAFQRLVEGFGDAFVAKLNTQLSGAASLVYSTLLGGSDFEVAFSLAVDAAGNAYVTGSTDSGLSFDVMPGAFQSVGGGGNCGTFEFPRHCQDAFVTKLNATGSALVYSTFLGGLGNDFGNGIAVDGNGSAYVVGQTFAADFPVLNPVQAQKASGCCTDGFVTRLSPTGAALVYSTYLGGGADDFVSDLALDAAGNAFVIGTAQSTDFPLVDPLQPLSRGDGDAFIAKLGNQTCTFTLTPSTRSITASATTGTISVAASSAGCQWSATSGAAWITLTGNTSGTGGGTVAYSASANAGTASRTGTVSVGGKTFTLTQAGAASTITVSVSSPNGGEKLYQASSYRIEWVASGTISSFDVESSVDGGVTFAAVPGCAALAGSARSCTWAAPSPLTSNGRVRVTARAAGGASISDASNAAFTIAAGSGLVTVTYPNSAVNVGIGSLQKIAWSHNLGTNSYVKVELSRDGGGTYPEVLGIVRNAASTSGDFAWRVTGPATSGVLARVRVSSVSTPAADFSNANFTIAPVFIAVTAPTSTANWGFGTTRRQLWTTNLGELDRVDVQLRTSASGAFTTLAGGANIVANKNGVNVTAPNTATTTARVRVVWNNAPAGSSAVAISPADFKVQPPFISVTAPAAGTIWTAGTAASVRWSHNLGTLESVKIELSKDSGATYPVVLSSSTVSDGSQNFTVQSSWGPQSTTRVKITWRENTAVSGQSGAFTVK